MTEIIDRATKELKNQDPDQDPTINFNLTVLQHIKDGLRPSKIAARLGISQPALQYHLNQLKAAGLIRKLGYGTWEVTEPSEELKKQDPKELKKTTQVTLVKTPNLKFLGMPDSVRGHAFVFVLKVPDELNNWNNRRRQEYLNNHGIAWKELKIGGRGERIYFEGQKIWLTNRSVIIYERNSYFAETAKDARKTAIFSLVKTVKKLERLLRADFTFKAGREYRFKVSRQHYALVKNALAEQYDSEGRRLLIREPASGKLWFVIDNSFSLHEAETVHAETSVNDNEKVQSFFNSLKANPLTTKFILESFASVAENQQAITANQQAITANQAAFGENMRTHVEAIRKIGDGVEQLNVLLAKLETNTAAPHPKQACGTTTVADLLKVK